MPNARRRFILHAGAAATVLSLGRTGLALASGAPAAAADFSVAAFMPLIGRDFVVSKDTAQYRLRLAEVVPLKKASGYPDEKRALERCFTLVFRSSEKIALADGICDFSTDGRASFQAFVSPIRGDGRSFQVVFSQI